MVLTPFVLGCLTLNYIFLKWYNITFQKPKTIMMFNSTMDWIDKLMPFLPILKKLSYM